MAGFDVAIGVADAELIAKNVPAATAKASLVRFIPIPSLFMQCDHTLNERICSRRDSTRGA
jgi:hypothetical protein